MTPKKFACNACGQEFDEPVVEEAVTIAPEPAPVYKNTRIKFDADLTDKTISEREHKVIEMWKQKDNLIQISFATGLTVSEAKMILKKHNLIQK